MEQNHWEEKKMSERKSIGDINFDSTIHCGSGYGFYKKAENHYAFRTRLGDALYSWRFYFKITSPGDGRKIILEVTDFDHEGRTPWNEGAAVFSYDCRQWNDIGTDNIKIVDWTPPENSTPYGDNCHVPYGVRYELTLDKKEIWVASPTPFTLENRDELLNHLVETYPNFTKFENIGETYHSTKTAYPMTGIHITDFSYPDTEKLRCLIIAGEHPAESAGIYAGVGMMNSLLNKPDLLRSFDFHFIPLANPDGIFHGRTYHNTTLDKSDTIGYNITLDWADFKHPETQNIASLIQAVNPHFFLRLHNGRHRKAYEFWINKEYLESPLVDSLTNAMNTDIDRIRPLKENRECSIHSKYGVPIVMTFETLLLEKNNGYTNWKTSYLSVGEELLTGITDGLNVMRKSLS
jgi:Zinc carboxypeptidase